MWKKKLKIRFIVIEFEVLKLNLNENMWKRRRIWSIHVNLSHRWQISTICFKKAHILYTALDVIHQLFRGFHFQFQARIASMWSQIGLANSVWWVVGPLFTGLFFCVGESSSPKYTDLVVIGPHVNGLWCWGLGTLSDVDVT